MTQDFPPAFWLGIEQFNQQQFYACHDTLEALWMEAAQPEKAFYQGILQIAVALYHLGNHNWRGAVILLGEGIQRLRPYEPDYGQVDVERLITQSADLLTILHQTRPEQLANLLQSQSDQPNQVDQPIAQANQPLCLPTVHKIS